jgi:hypothetical protein
MAAILNLKKKSSIKCCQCNFEVITIRIFEIGSYLRFIYDFLNEKKLKTLDFGQFVFI